jgi:histidinol dehydrogenase
MKTFLLPPENEWDLLCVRPSIVRSDLESRVREIISQVRNDGDEALLSFAEKFDGHRPSSLRVSQEEIAAASLALPSELKSAIKAASDNIAKFHRAQLADEAPVETTAGVRCWRRNTAIQKVGLYIPGGTAPLFSTVLMLAIPAKIAGCSEIIICTPPSRDGNINPAILYAAGITGVTSIFRTGGAQAIAAMAYGTQSIPKVFKIFGPGNQYVTKAKELVQQDGIAIDMPAGPSEVLVIADSSADPAFVAADLLSQAEHGTDSQVILLTTDRELIKKVEKETELQLGRLPRKDIAAGALEHSRIILLPSLDACLGFSNLYAPEHLIINVTDPEKLASGVINAGSVFLGKWSCESAGDYASGTNHTLPTNGYAKSYSGVSTDSFIRKITFQYLSEKGISNIGPSIEIMAEAESLKGHSTAVGIRLKSLEND